LLSEPFLAEHYDVGEKYIRTRDGRIEYKFTGLRHNIDSIKSKALIKLLWVDEAEAVSEGAWRKAIPSVREMDSEDLGNVEPGKRKEPDAQAVSRILRPGSKIVEMNYADNPWFPDVLDLERSEDLAKRPDDYAHVWLGAFRTNSEAQVFKNWRVEEFEPPKDAVSASGLIGVSQLIPPHLSAAYVSGGFYMWIERPSKSAARSMRLPTFSQGITSQSIGL
jgi:phage terminase large subunit